MSFRYHIKINHTKHLTDARFAAAAGVNYMGFCFDNASEAFIPPIKAKEIIDWTSGSHIVGEFGKQAIEDINTIVQLLNIDIVELIETVSLNQFEEIDVPVILAIDIENYSANDLLEFCKQYQNHVQAFHLYNWEAMAQNHADLFNKIDNQLILHLKDNFTEKLTLLSFINPFGLSFDGDSEEKAGMRDFESLSDFLEQLQIQE